MTSIDQSEARTALPDVLVTLVMAVLRMVAHLAYNLLTSWPWHSALRRVASSPSPPSLSLMAQVMGLNCI